MPSNKENIMKRTLFASVLAIIFVAAAFGQDVSKSDLIGTWSNGGMSMIGERNTVTGSTTPSNGHTFKFVFAANGRFAYTGLLNSTQYGCTLGLFNDKQGSYSLDGDTLTLTLSKNFWRNTNSCSAAATKTRNYTLGDETYTVSTKTDEYGKAFICLTNDKGETCYRKEN